MSTGASTKSVVKIGDTEVTRIEYRGQQVVTFAMIDKVHGRVEGTARRTFNENRDRFSDGVDFVKVSADEIRSHKIVDLSPKARGAITFVTRRGYLKIVKSLNDDRAWAVFDDMIERYFAFERVAGTVVPLQPGRAEAREVRLYFKHALSVAKMAGLEGNQRLIAANRATRKVLGVDLLETMGVPTLPSPEPEVLLNPTEIGARLGLSAQRVNRLLEQHGFQEERRDAKGRMQWEPTEKGIQAGAHMVEVERSNKTGEARQLRWASSIVDILAGIIDPSPTAVRAQVRRPIALVNPSGDRSRGSAASRARRPSCCRTARRGERRRPA